VESAVPSLQPLTEVCNEIRQDDPLPKRSILISRRYRANLAELCDFEFYSVPLHSFVPFGNGTGTEVRRLFANQLCQCTPPYCSKRSKQCYKPSQNRFLVAVGFSVLNLDLPAKIVFITSLCSGCVSRFELQRYVIR